MRKTIHQFLSNTQGATAIEYGVIVAVLSLAIVGGVGTAGNSLQFLWSDNNSRLVEAMR